MTTAIDCLVNVDFGDEKQPEWMVRVKEDYFKGGDSFFKSPELPELLDDMDANGVERAILHDQGRRRATTGRSASSTAAPDRFALGVGGLQPAAADEGAARRSSRSCATTRSPTPSVGPELLGRRHVPAERRRLLPALHEVLRARPAAVHEHRHPRAADPGRGAEPDPPRPGVRPLPGAAAVHDPRRRPVVGHRHPPDAQVPEPAADDLGVVAEAPARVAAALHARRGARTGSCSPPTTRCSRWSGASARRRPSTCPTRCATRGSTATPRPSSSETLDDMTRSGGAHGRQADRRRQPLLRAARRLHPAPRPEVHATGACRPVQDGKRVAAARSAARSTGSSPTRRSTRSSCPAASTRCSAARSPRASTRATLMQVEPLRAEYQRPRRAARR